MSGLLEADCCGHEFATRRQRVEHEQKVERGQRVLCPCGDVCSEGDVSQTSAVVDALPDASLLATDAPCPAVPTDLTASAPDRAADVASPTTPKDSVT